LGSKHELLTWDEVEKAQLRPVLKDILNDFIVSGRQSSQIRILDLGCGRGITVLKLLQQGFDAYGVDVDPVPVRNGLPLLAALDFLNPPVDRLRICTPGDPFSFPDDFFDVIFSEQVFEHISDLETVAGELARMAHVGSLGIHIFPAKWKVVEPHVFVPFVHWLPKNEIRYLWMRLFKNRLPIWHGHDAMNLSERLDVFYKYLNEKTFYRPLKKIFGTLRASGLQCHIHLQNNTKITIKFISSLFMIFRHCLRAWRRTTFHEVVIITRN
jgi:SAM-dependent methyltransferase